MEKYTASANSNPNNVIVATNVSKTYKGAAHNTLVGVGPKQGLSFSVKRNEVFGIIGPDGAGKTTLFRLMTSLLKPDKGVMTVLGQNAATNYRDIRNHIGYMPGTFSLYPDLTVKETLHFFAKLFNTTVEANYNLVKHVYQQIEPFQHRKARNLSGGMKQKLALSCALIHKPQILFLDEPTTGIDPLSRVDLWDMLRMLSNSGVTVVVSTAYMDEVKRCDRVAFMLDGQFLSVNSPSKFEQQYPYPLFAVQGNRRLELLERLRTYPNTVSCYAFGETLHLSVKPNTAASEVESFLSQTGLQANITPITANIEDAFMNLSENHKA